MEKETRIKDEDLIDSITKKINQYKELNDQQKQLRKQICIEMEMLEGNVKFKEWMLYEIKGMKVI